MKAFILEVINDDNLELRVEYDHTIETISLMILENGTVHEVIEIRHSEFINGLDYLIKEAD